MKRNDWLRVALILSAVSLVAQGADPPKARSVPLNGGFEAVTTLPGGILMPKCWQPNSAFEKSGSCAVVEEGRTGQRAFRLDAAKGTFHAFTSTGWPIVRGTNAVIRCAARGKGNFCFWIYCYAPRVGWVGGNVVGPLAPLTLEWTEHEFTLEIPEKPFPKGPVETVKLAIAAEKGAELFLDDLSLELTVQTPESTTGGGIDVALTLPPVLYAVPGQETNVYFDNTVLVINPANLVFDVICSRGTQQRERWSYTPDEGDVGEHVFTLSVYDDGNELLARSSTVLRVVPPGAAAQLKILMIGDSLTHASAYPAHVLAGAAKDEGMDLTLLGTHTPREGQPEVRHEGYGGWTAGSFVRRYSAEAWAGGRRAGSPFLFVGQDGKPALDLARYYRENCNGSAPDVVTIFLGPNDIFGAGEETKEAAIATSLANFDILIEAIRQANPKTVIGLLLPAPPAATQDAFGTNYACGQTRWQCKRNQHRMVQHMIDRYAGREGEHLYLLPTSVSLDPVNGFPSRTAKANAHSAADLVRLSNGLHPAESGYRQIGDTVYAWLKSIAAAAKAE